MPVRPPIKANRTLQRAQEQIERAEAAYASAEAALAEIDRKECATLQKQFATGAWPAPPPNDDQRKDHVDVFLNRAAVEALRSFVQVPGNPYGQRSSLCHSYSERQTRVPFALLKSPAFSRNNSERRQPVTRDVGD